MRPGFHLLVGWLLGEKGVGCFWAALSLNSLWVSGAGGNPTRVPAPDSLLAGLSRTWRCAQTRVSPVASTGYAEPGDLLPMHMKTASHTVLFGAMNQASYGGVGLVVLCIKLVLIF